MTTRQAPEIFQIPLDDLDPAGLPPRGTPEFEQAVIGRYALDYAARGWQAVVTVDDAFVRVVAVPERGVEPKAYVLGLLEHGNRSLSGVLLRPPSARNNPSHIHQGGAGSDQGDCDQQQVAAA